MCCAQVGLDKLLTAEREVNVMKQELIELQPKLIETGELGWVVQEQWHGTPACTPGPADFVDQAG